MKKIILAVAVTALAIMAVASSASAGPSTGVTATPATTQKFSGTFSATFVRSASGIINETNRTNSAGNQNDWTNADVWLQFRPTTGPTGTGSPQANSACDPVGLVDSFLWSNDLVADPAIKGTTTSGYFIGANQYRVCVYLVNPVVAKGSIDSRNWLGTTTANLPSKLAGNYRISVQGMWQGNSSDQNLVDAEYVTGNAWTNWSDGPAGYGEDQGDLQVNGTFVNWGTYNADHAYSLLVSGGDASGNPVNLAMFDGDASTNMKNESWYSDNTGSLDYTITYVG